MSFCLKYSNKIRPMCRIINRGFAAGDTIASLGKAKKKVGKQLGAPVEKVLLPVETDPKKLVNFVCGLNIKQEGQDVELKPDNEYPDWLWTLNTGKPKPLSEMDPNTLEYWKRVRKLGMKRNNIMKSIKPF